MPWRADNPSTATCNSNKVPITSERCTKACDGNRARPHPSACAEPYSDGEPGSIRWHYPKWYVTDTSEITTPAGKSRRIPVWSYPLVVNVSTAGCVAALAHVDAGKDTALRRSGRMGWPDTTRPRSTNAINGAELEGGLAEQMNVSDAV